MLYPFQRQLPIPLPIWEQKPNRQLATQLPVADSDTDSKQSLYCSSLLIDDSKKLTLFQNAHCRFKCQ